MPKREHIIKAVREALSIDTRIYSRRDIFPRKALTPEECSARQRAGVLEHTAPDCRAEDILLIIDTADGKGTRGLVFTEHAMYGSKDILNTGLFSEPVPQPLRYEEFAKTDKKSGSTLVIEMPDGRRYEIKGAYTSFLFALRKYLYRAMGEIKREEAAQKKEALARSAGEILARGEALAASGDIPGMVRCLAEAAETGDGEAMYRYAQHIKDHGEEDRALSYLKKAAAQGHTEAAEEYRRLKNRQDQEYTIAVANYKLENYEEASLYFIKLARRGVAKACYQSGCMYLYGQGVQQNEEIAFSYFKSAADIGYTRGMMACAKLYRSGQGVKEDRNAGYMMMEKAADLGDIDAKLALRQNRPFDLYDIFCENMK